MEGADHSTIWPYDEHGEPRRFYYSRTDHPAGAAAEAELGRREGGDALLYASGMGAVTTVLLAFARPGTTIALAEGCYYGTSKLLRLLAGWGISYVEYDQAGPAPGGRGHPPRGPRDPRPADGTAHRERIRARTAP